MLNVYLDDQLSDGDWELLKGVYSMSILCSFGFAALAGAGADL
jgi:hypothetical protein